MGERKPLQGAVDAADFEEFATSVVVNKENYGELRSILFKRRDNFKNWVNRKIAEEIDEAKRIESGDTQIDASFFNRRSSSTTEEIEA